MNLWNEKDESLENKSFEIEVLSTPKEVTTTTTTEQTTTKNLSTTTNSPVVIIQLTDKIPLNKTYFEIMHVKSNKKKLKPSTIKHIVHLDDYEEDFEDEEIFKEEIQQKER